MNKNVINNAPEKQTNAIELANSYSSNSSIILSIMTLEMVGIIIKLKHLGSIKRWLNANDIKIYRVSKVSYVYELDVACAVNIPYVRELKRICSSNWKDLYKQMEKNDTLYNLILYKIDSEINHTPTTKVKRRSKSDEELYKKLIS